MQSLIQQIGVRAGTLLMRRHPQTSIAHGYTGAHGAGGVAETADEQIKLLNGLLQTVCHKLLAKMKELDCVSGELSNLIKSCAIPAIFVDENLMVRSFTRESRQVYRLSNQDIGRPLLDIKCSLDYCSLGDDFRTSFGGHDALRGAIEDLHCVGVLDERDRSAERRLADVEHLRGASQAFALGDRDQLPQLGERNDHSPPH